ncbi:MAG: tRNA 5-methoxyuridine(34)/uridine 5-oxyacetic acid(34) synthase CmoB [Deltaproteobacteria bacterium]|nr:tRNA 5-methoxyuridine(34)/uridine 5-oxyacetic acid(34) synthase CmoB [Deltaproteobacteria bacterium]
MLNNIDDLRLKWVSSALTQEATKKLTLQSNRDLVRWNDALQRIASVSAEPMHITDGQLCVGNDTHPVASHVCEFLEAALKQLCPWRKGPFWVHGIHIDTEWRSDLKWERVKPHISELTYRTVLDVGCGNGYHCFRMALDGAKTVIGVDPFLLSNMQFWAMTALSGQSNVCVLPLGVDDVPQTESFDTVFSMGLLYHRKSPIDHLFQLKGFLRPGGEMVLETLVIEGKEGEVLVPRDRYAMMRNVWFVPSIESLHAWILRVGFQDVRLVDVTRTSYEEQRSTSWMTFDSLKDFLDPDDTSRTREGYPAPLRAVFIAQKPM